MKPDNNTANQSDANSDDPRNVELSARGRRIRELIIANNELNYFPTTDAAARIYELERKSFEAMEFIRALKALGLINLHMLRTRVDHWRIIQTFLETHGDQVEAPGEDHE